VFFLFSSKILDEDGKIGDEKTRGSSFDFVEVRGDFGGDFEGSFAATATVLGSILLAFVSSFIATLGSIFVSVGVFLTSIRHVFSWQKPVEIKQILQSNESKPEKLTLGAYSKHKLLPFTEGVKTPFCVGFVMDIEKFVLSAFLEIATHIFPDLSLLVVRTESGKSKTLESDLDALFVDSDVLAVPFLSLVLLHEAKTHKRTANNKKLLGLV
jgi:hypothetical protein